MPTTDTLPRNQADTASDSERIAAAAIELGTPADIAGQAGRNLADRRVLFLVVSGKIASGKDTVAPAVLDALGITHREHLYYAKALKDEVDQFIADIRTCHVRYGHGSDRQLLARYLAETHQLPAAAAMLYATELYDEVLAVPGLHARMRTAVVRHVLQYHGTEVRRSQDENYWVKKALHPALALLAEGQSVYFTDARFPNEIASAQPVGAVTVRLDISPEIQLRRLRERDGDTNPAALRHISETALDDYTGFDLRFNNDGSLDDAVARIVNHIRPAAATAA